MNWSQFKVTTPRRSAIFSEEFPASWAEVLARATRRLVAALDVAATDRAVAVEFLAVELAEGLIVVAHARIRGVINPRR